MFRNATIPNILIAVSLAFASAACSSDEAPARQAEQADAGSLGARLVPALEAGTISGINVYEVSDTGLAHELGLRDGDRITAVDGQPITSADRANGLIDRLEQGERPELAVEREEG